MTKPAGFFTYFHHSALINHLTDEQAGRLFKALLIYGDEGEIADLDDDQACTLAFIIMKGEIDRNLSATPRRAKSAEKQARRADAPEKAIRMKRLKSMTEQTYNQHQKPNGFLKKQKNLR